MPSFQSFRRGLIASSALGLAACTPQVNPAPQPAGGGPAANAPMVTAAAPERAIRRTIPMWNTIRRAHAAGTRDSTGRPGARYWQNRVDYVIRARLDVATSKVTATESIVLHNQSDSALRVVVLRLDQNIFRAGAARASAMPTVEVTEGVAVTRITVNGEAVELDPAPPRPGAPPKMAAYNLDQTVARITMPTPIPAKARATIEIDWNFKVPNVSGGRGLRMGRLADSLYQVAQWYPRVAVYDDLRGWDTEPYLGPSEFHNNFGSWDVTIDVPAGWIVGATGTLRNPEDVLTPTARQRLAQVLESDEQRTIVGANEFGAGRATRAGDRLAWRFTADTANDFAWATSRAYVWDATRATIPDRGRIPVHILYLPGDTSFRRGGPIVRHALEFYSRLWMPYAFPQLTMADGPELGMEYPMIIFSGLGAADHEVGHEWWPMMVGNDETRFGWMDEGFNQYMNVLSSAARRNQPANLDGPGQSYGNVSGSDMEPAMMWDANYGGPFYGFQTYSKAPLMLSMLGGIVGDSAVQRAMSDYAKAWRFRQPSPWDYTFFMNRALGLRADGARDHADAERTHGGQRDGDRDVAGGRVVRRRTHLQRDAGLRRAADHRDPARPVPSVPGQQQPRQRLAEGGAVGGAVGAPVAERGRRYPGHRGLRRFGAARRSGMRRCRCRSDLWIP